MEWKPTTLIPGTPHFTEPGSIHFRIGDESIISLRPNGDILVRGRLLVNDEDLVQGLRDVVNAYRAISPDLLGLKIKI